MANTFLTPEIIATRALATLYETTVMAQLVHRDFDGDFRGKQGDTITVRKPATFTAAEFDRNTGVVPQNATETGVDVTLNHFSDVSFNVTTEQLTLEIEDFGTQLLDPAMEAIAQKIDTDLLALRNDVVQTVGDTVGRELTKPEILIDAGKVLNQAKVPTTDRHAVIGPVTNADWLDSDVLKKVNESGSTEALREAYLGRRLFGFDPYWTQHVTEPEEGVAFHRTAFALVTRPLEVPPGAQDATIMNYKGFGLRVVYDYDIKYKQTVVSVDCLYGTKTLDANRAVLLSGAGS
ncbi:P22 phage major capsid protein family protein [Streptomyces antibioticus]|uniref:P22 phage major capsid protein family protein n=1 Tax=Streptomyces antibioticus TaxID=1890 RepID=UPI0036AB450C